MTTEKRPTEERNARFLPMLEIDTAHYYFYMLESLKKAGVEVYGGISFSNMDGESPVVALYKALDESRKRDYDDEYRTRERIIGEEEIDKQVKEREKAITSIASEEIKRFYAQNKGTHGISIEDVISFIYKLSEISVFMPTSPRLQIPQDKADLVLEVLKESGYEPISQEIAYSSEEKKFTGEINKIITDCSEYRTYIPRGALDYINNHSEGGTTGYAMYGIGNFMLQLQQGEFDFTLRRFGDYYCWRREEEKKQQQQQP